MLAQDHQRAFEFGRGDSPRREILHEIAEFIRLLNGNFGFRPHVA
jgi:hypothetical protein